MATTLTTYEIENPREFILAGNSYFTAQSNKTNNHLTYKVSKCDDKNMFFVSVCYEYGGYGFIGNLWCNDELTSFNFVKSKKFVDDNVKSVLAFEFIIKNYLIPGVETPQAPNTITFYHHGKCGRCGRPLTTPESIKRGLGPYCAGL